MCIYVKLCDFYLKKICNVENSFKSLVENLERSRPLELPIRVRENGIKIDILNGVDECVLDSSGSGTGKF